MQKCLFNTGQLIYIVRSISAMFSKETVEAFLVRFRTSIHFIALHSTPIKSFQRYIWKFAKLGLTKIRIDSC